jgi:hypothetical protein
MDLRFKKIVAKTKILKKTNEYILTISFSGILCFGVLVAIIISKILLAQIKLL